MTADFQDRLLDELMPEKKPKEEPPIVEGVAPAGSFKARLPAVLAKAEAIALSDDAPDWRGTCAICLDLLPANLSRRRFYDCCCKSICTDCSGKCLQHDLRCPLCRAPPPKTADEWLRRLQKHVDKGNAKAQIMLATKYFNGNVNMGRMLSWRPSCTGALPSKDILTPNQISPRCSTTARVWRSRMKKPCGGGASPRRRATRLWYRRAAEQGYPLTQFNLGQSFYHGEGVAQSNAEAVKWLRLAAAQGHAKALHMLGACHANGEGVPQDFHEALRLCKRAVAEGHADAAAAVDKILASLAAERAK